MKNTFKIACGVLIFQVLVAAYAISTMPAEVVVDEAVLVGTAD